MWFAGKDYLFTCQAETWIQIAVSKETVKAVIVNKWMSFKSEAEKKARINANIKGLAKDAQRKKNKTKLKL